MFQLKKMLALFILLAFSLQTFSRSLNWVAYWANTEAFIKTCINKAKPASTCKGKCQIMKKMAEEEKNDSKTPAQKYNEKEEVLSCRHFFCFLPEFLMDHKKVYPAYIFGLPSERPIDFFQPPGH